MRSRQAGITFIGCLFLLAPVAVVGYAAIRLTPVYLNSMKVSKALKQTADEYKGESVLSPLAVRKALDRRFTIDSITYPKVTDVTVERDASGWVLAVNYDDEVPMFAGISLLVNFDKRAAVE